jgi:uncharacterized membrane protein
MMRIIVLLLLALFLATLAHADTISDINLKVRGDGYADIEERVIFENEGNYGIIHAPQFADSPIISDDGGNLTYELTDIGGTAVIKVNFKEAITAKKTKEVLLTYGTHYLTSKEGDLWTLKFSAAATPRKTILRILLPEKSTLVTMAPEGLLRTNVKDGVWIYPQETELNFTGTYRYDGTKPPLSTTTTTIRRSQDGILSIDAKTAYAFVFALLVSALIVVAYWVYTKKKLLPDKIRGYITINASNDVVPEAKAMADGKVSYNIDTSSAPRGAKRVKESIIKMLDEIETSIIKILENSEEDEVTQAYIYKTTGIPKSSLSDILKQLEKRNIIERRIDGRVKWIKLKSWVLE